MRRLKTRGQEQPAEEMFDLVGENGIATAEARIAASEVMQALTRLPEDQRAIVSLVCIEELSYREVASILDIPIGTVMSRLARGRRALGAMLGMAGAETEPAGT
jgi:RNA polymerase sigma-70 factor (ECF subfamily)